MITNTCLNHDELWEITFQKQYGWWSFFGIILFILVTNVPGLVYLCVINTDDSVIQAHNEIISFFDLLGNCQNSDGNSNNTSGGNSNNASSYNCSNAYLNEEFAEVNQAQNFLNSYAEKAWICCLTSLLVNLLFLTVITIVVIINRKTKKVKNRGNWFLVHLFSSSFLYFPVALLFSATALNQIPGLTCQFILYDNAVSCSSCDRVANAIFALMIISLFCVANFQGAIINRMHLVYLSYSSSIRIRTQRPHTKTKHNDGAFRYLFSVLWPNLLIQFLLFLFSITSIVIAYTQDSYLTGWWPFSTTVIQCLVCLIWVSVYTYICRSVDYQFSDYYKNFRFMGLVLVVLVFLYLVESLFKTVLRYAILQFSGQIFIVGYCGDQFISLFFYQFWKDIIVVDESVKYNQMSNILARYDEHPPSSTVVSCSTNKNLKGSTVVGCSTNKTLKCSNNVQTDLEQQGEDYYNEKNESCVNNEKCKNLRTNNDKKSDSSNDINTNTSDYITKQGVVEISSNLSQISQP